MAWLQASFARQVVVLSKIPACLDRPSSEQEIGVYAENKP